MHILLVARHYPPEISGGARRPSLYVQALRQLGHRVTVVTPFDINDEDSVTVKSQAIENGCRAIHDKQHKTVSKGALSKLKDFLRIWMYWPDENIRWVKNVIKVVEAHNLEPDWIMTTSPPESIHIAGARLSKVLNKPWIAELRDTWIEVPHRIILEQSRFRAAVERRIAKRTLRSASAVTAVSEAVMQEVRQYVRSTTPELIISHFSDKPPREHIFDSAKLNLVHTGGFTLSDRRRTLPPLLEVLEEIRVTHPNLMFHIAGPLSPDEAQLIKMNSTLIMWHGSVSLDQSRALQVGADALILYSPTNSHALPGKYAEYALSSRPIYYFGGGNWLQLVEDTRNLRPLVSSATTLKKNETVVTHSALDHISAAKALIEFLQSVSSESVD